jgi:gliding motility-associated lipoprotein GldD
MILPFSKTYNLAMTFLLSALLLTSCQDSYLPKPRGYHRLDLPKPIYQRSQGPYPYSFEQNSFAKMVADTTRFSEKYWSDVQYPGLNAEVELTYKTLTSREQLSELIKDSRTLVTKHQIKASSIEEGSELAGTGDRAYLFELQGQVPSQFQFYVTDSSKHFLRGALYFKVANRNDSLSPVIRYIAEDIHHLLRTLRWQTVPLQKKSLSTFE